MGQPVCLEKSYPNLCFSAFICCNGSKILFGKSFGCKLFLFIDKVDKLIWITNLLRSTGDFIYF